MLGKIPVNKYEGRVVHGHDGRGRMKSREREVKDGREWYNELVGN